jgi:regulation of enolase protein 1 (concanavalin A-like superfamily)
VANVFEGHTVKIFPLLNDFDKDKDEIVLCEVLSPLHGKITSSNKKVLYTAIKGFTGIDSFAYNVSDGRKKSRKAYIKVKVNENLRPIAKDDHIQLYPGSNIPLFVLGNDEDKEGDSIFIRGFTAPLHGKIQQQGNILLYTCDKKSAPTDSFKYTISDGYNQSDEAKVILTVQNKNNPCYPWLSAGVGNPSISGGLISRNNGCVIKASGNDIWGNTDNFHYAYQIITGDFEITTKILNIDDTDPWAKAGIMIRGTLYGSSKNVFMCISSKNGASFQQRMLVGAETESTHQGKGVKAPYWVRVTRQGNIFKGYSSPDGNNWTEEGNYSMAMNANVYVGLAVSSHNEAKLCSAHFDALKIKIQNK